MTTRRITREQFSDSLAIDSSRIQKAMEDIEGYTNEIPLEALKHKFSMNHIALTCQGAETDDNNDDIGVQQGRMLPCPYFPTTQGTNKRIKGLQRLSSSAAATAAGVSVATPLAWTTSTIFPRPVVLDTIAVFIEGSKLSASISAGVVTSFTMFNSANDQSYHRVRVIIDTDNMTAAEDRRLNSKELVIKEFDEVEYSDAVEDFSAATDMKPSDIMTPQTRGKNRLFLEKKELNLPIHQFARVRFRLLVYGPGLASDQAATNAEVRPLQTTFYIGYKEMLRG